MINQQKIPHVIRLNNFREKNDLSGIIVVRPPSKIILPTYYLGRSGDSWNSSLGHSTLVEPVDLDERRDCSGNVAQKTIEPKIFRKFDPQNVTALSTAGMMIINFFALVLSLVLFFLNCNVLHTQDRQLEPDRPPALEQKLEEKKPVLTLVDFVRLYVVAIIALCTCRLSWKRQHIN